MENRERSGKDRILDVTRFASEGFLLLPDVLAAAQCDALAQRLRPAPAGKAGSRSLLSQPWCRALAGQLRSHAALAPLLPPDALAVQCTLFEKSTGRNWLVPLHQDLSIPVAARVPDPRLRGWSEKEGVLFVLAPVDVLQQLVAVRLHVDDCSLDDGPLRVLPGSHQLGLLDEVALSGVAAHAAAPTWQDRREVVCAAPRGSVLVLRPLLLHASSRAGGTSLRRVLHFVFGPRQLPCGLQWWEPA